MKKYNIVLDTNVLISALRSKRGASFQLISLLEKDKFKINISVPLILEYESIITQELNKLAINKKDFQGAEKLGIKILSPQEFINLLEKKK